MGRKSGGRLEFAFRPLSYFGGWPLKNWELTKTGESAHLNSVFSFFAPPFQVEMKKVAKRPEIPVLFAPPPLFYTPLSLRGLLPIFPKKTMAIGPSNLRESQTGVNARISLRFSVVSPFFCPERRKRAKQKDTRFATTSVSALFLRGQHP